MLNLLPALPADGRTPTEETRSLELLSTGWLASGWAVIAARYAQTCADRPSDGNRTAASRETRRGEV